MPPVNIRDQVERTKDLIKFHITELEKNKSQYKLLKITLIVQRLLEMRFSQNLVCNCRF